MFNVITSIIHGICNKSVSREKLGESYLDFHLSETRSDTVTWPRAERLPGVSHQRRTVFREKSPGPERVCLGKVVFCVAQSVNRSAQTQTPWNTKISIHALRITNLKNR